MKKVLRGLFLNLYKRKELLAGLLIGASCVLILNPGHIVQKSLSLVGIGTTSEQIAQSNPISLISQDKVSESGNPATSTNADVSQKTDSTTANSSTELSTPEPTGSHTVITPADIQAQKDSGAPLLIAKTDWDVKVNSRSPTSCGTSSNRCSVGQQATVNVSAYNTHTNELLPITECNGVWNKPYVGGDATTTSLPDANHCVLTFTPSSSGMYRLQIELYLSKSVYTDTIYWGGWVWGTDSPNSDGYFVN